MIFHPLAKIILGDTCLTKNDYIKKLPVIVDSKDSWIKETGLFLQNYLDDEPELVLQSSGTTGDVKSMATLKSKMRRSAIMTGTYFSLLPGTNALLSLPGTYIAGKMMIVRSLTLGLTLHIVKPSSDPFAENQDLPMIDFAPFVPLQVLTMLKNDTSCQRLSTISQILLGGAQIDHLLFEKLRVLPNKIYESFGMTETLSHIAIRAINDKREDEPAFKALRDVFFDVDDRDCLIVQCPALLDSPLVTNDVVSLINSTTFQWKGRFDNVINSGGIKIIPEVIENKLRDVIPGIFCIVSQPDERLGQKPVLVIESMHPKTLDVHELLDSMRQCLDTYQMPKEIYCMAQMVRNTHGKLLRKVMATNISAKSNLITKLYP